MGKRKIKSEVAIQGGGDTLVIEQREKSWLLRIGKKSIIVSEEAMTKFLNNITTNIRADGSFNGTNPKALMTDCSYLIDSKRYAGKERKFLSLFTDVLSSSNGISDKMEIFCLQRDDEPIGLYATIKRWKKDKESKVFITINERILAQLVSDEPQKKKNTDEEFIEHVNEEIKSKSHSTPGGLESEEKTTDQNKIDKAYANLLFQEMMQKSSQYCASCNGHTEPHRSDCLFGDPLKFLAFHIGIANVNLLSLGKERWSELVIGPSCTDFDVDKINHLFNNLNGNGEWRKVNISFYLLKLLSFVKDQLFIHL